MKLMNLQLFDDTVTPIEPSGYLVKPINITKQNDKANSADMSPTMKTFYDTSLLENAREAMVFTQLGKKQAMHGNTIEWRKFNTFPKALADLEEGVIPTGEKFGMTSITAGITQHGDYVAVTDRLELEAYDDIIYGATEEMGAAEGETYDTLTRNILVAGNSVAYAPIVTASGETAVTSRADLTSAAVLTPKLIAKAATWLKNNKAPKYDGQTYVAVVHPYVAYDLRQSDEWKEFHKYADVAPIFNGEIGTLHGIRFIECTNAKVWEAAGASSADVYCTLFFGKDAFGVLDPNGEGMEMIVKDRSQIGGPLNQFSTIGYKFCHGAKILYQDRMLRIESGSSYNFDVAQ